METIQLNKMKKLLCPPLHLSDLEQEEVCSNCASVFSSLEAEQKEVSRLVKENKALVNGMFQLQNQVLLLLLLLLLLILCYFINSSFTSFLSSLFHSSGEQSSDAAQGEA